jgi:hypothetical protein
MIFFEKFIEPQNLIAPDFFATAVDEQQLLRANQGKALAVPAQF